MLGHSLVSGECDGCFYRGLNCYTAGLQLPMYEYIRRDMMRITDG